MVKIKFHLLYRVRKLSYKVHRETFISRINLLESQTKREIEPSIKILSE